VCVGNGRCEEVYQHMSATSLRLLSGMLTLRVAANASAMFSVIDFVRYFVANRRRTWVISFRNIVQFCC